MRTRTEVQEEMKVVSKKWNDLKDELTKIDLGELNLTGKYVYLDIRGLYMHIENFWVSSRREGNNSNNNVYEIILEGETFAGMISEYTDDTYFHWDQYNQVTVNPGFRYTEITEEEFKKELEDLKKALL